MIRKVFILVMVAVLLVTVLPSTGINTSAGATAHAAVLPADILSNWAWRNPWPQGYDINDVIYANGQYVAVGGSGTVLTSGDGASWNVHKNAAKGAALRGVAYGNGTYVAVESKRIFTSANAVTWMEAFELPDIPGYNPLYDWMLGPSPYHLSSVAFGNGMFIAVGTYFILKSENGTHWEIVQEGNYNPLNAIAFGDDRFVAVGNNGYVLHSRDGVNWTGSATPKQNLYDVIYIDKGEGGPDDKIFVAAGNSGGIFVTDSRSMYWLNKNKGNNDSSPYFNLGYCNINDQHLLVAGGRTSLFGASRPKTLVMDITEPEIWTVVQINDNSLGKLASDGTGFVTAGWRGRILTSSDGLTWHEHSTGPRYHLYGAASHNGQFVAVGENTTIMTSSGGSGWHRHDLRMAYPDETHWSGSLYGVASNDTGDFVAVGEFGRIFKGSGSSWKLIPRLGKTLNAVAYGADKFVAVGDYGTMIISADGEDWSVIDNGTGGSSATLKGVAYGNGKFIAVGRGKVMISKDSGETWERGSGGGGGLSIAFGKGKFVVADSSGYVRTSTDGIRWNSLYPTFISAGGLRFSNVTYGNGLFVITASGFDRVSTEGLTSSYVLVSADGENWDIRKTGGLCQAAAYGANSFITVGTHGTILQSSLPASGAIVLPANSHYFGRLAPGDTSEYTFTVENHGSAGLGIESITVTGGAFSLKESIPGGFIEAGGSGSFTVEFAPATGGSHSGNVAIRSTDPYNSLVGISLSGKCISHTDDIVLQFQSPSYTVSFDGYSAYVTVVRTGDDRKVTVDFTTVDGTATSTSEYTQRSGTLTFEEGDTEKTFFISLRNLSGSPFTGAKTFTVELRNPGGGATLGSLSSTTVVLQGINEQTGAYEALSPLNWIHPHPTGDDIYALTFAKSNFLLCDQYGKVHVSGNGVNWTGTANVKSKIFAAAGNDSLYVIAGELGNIFTSTDAQIWTKQVSGTAATLRGLTHGGGKFVATGDNGTILLSDDGIAWVSKSLATQPNFTAIAYGNGIYAASAGDGIYVSNDGGDSWQRRFEGNFRSITYGIDSNGAGRFVAARAYGYTATSTDGMNWTLSGELTGSNFLHTVTYGNGVFAAASSQVIGGGYDFSSTYSVFVSGDGLNWTRKVNSKTGPWPCASAYGNGAFVMAGSVGGVIISTDNGNTWPEVNGSHLRINGIATGGGKTVAVGRNYLESGKNAMVSSDGVQWNKATTPAEWLNKVAYGNNLFAAVGRNRAIVTSPDGENWTLRASGTVELMDICFGNGRFVAVGRSGTVLMSEDGISWNNQLSGTSNGLLSVSFINGTFFATGENGILLSSPDGEGWTAKTIGSGRLVGIAYGNGRYVAMNMWGYYSISSDAKIWTQMSSRGIDIPTIYELSGLEFVNGVFVAVGNRNGYLYASPQGIVWDRLDAGTGANFRDIITDGDTLLFAGDYGAILRSDPIVQVQSAKISVEPAVIEFAGVLPGGQSEMSFTVTNEGPSQLSIGSITPPDGPFSLVDNSLSGITLGQNESVSQTVRFSPQEHGNYTGSLLIPSNDPATPLVVVTLTSAAEVVSVISFVSSGIIVDEGIGVVAVDVVRSGDIDTVVSVQYGVDPSGTAVAGQDYEPVLSGSLTFASGETLKTFYVTIIDDDDIEGDETIRLLLSSPSGGAVLGGHALFTITIADNDQPYVAPVLETNIDDIDEAKKGQIGIRQYFGIEVTANSAAGRKARTRLTMSNKPANARAELALRDEDGDTYTSLPWDDGDGYAWLDAEQGFALEDRAYALELMLDTPGGYTLECELLDAAGGNVLATLTIPIAASDTTPPVVFVSGLRNNAVIPDSVLKFSVLAADNADGDMEPVVELNGFPLVGEPAVDGRSFVYTANLEEGENIITIDAVDEAGNSTHRTFSITHCPDLEQELTALRIYGLVPTLRPGGSFDLGRLTLEGYDQYDNLLDISGSSVIWVSSDPAVSYIDDSFLRAVDTGFTRISANIDGIFSNAMLTAVTGDPHPEVPELVITTASLPSGTVGSPYSATLAASGGTAPYTWSATGLPAGLGISSGGVISGTPTTEGTFALTVTANDSAIRSTSKNFSLTVNRAYSGSNGGGSDGAATVSGISKDIKAAVGGTIGYGNVTVIIPPGTLPRDARISINKLSTSEADKVVPKGLRFSLAGDIYEITTTGERNFGDKTISIRIAFDPAKIAAGEQPVIRYLNEAAGQWIDLPTTVEQGADGKWYVVTHVKHLTKFAVFSAPVKEAVKTVIVLTLGRQTATVGGSPYTLDTVPFVDRKTNRTLVPVRFVGEALGAKVDWNPAKQQVTIRDDGREIILTIGSKNVLVDGQTITVDCAPVVVPPGRTFVPLRFVGETLGAAVHWEGSTQKITITINK